MKERHIPFKAHEVRATLAGTMTQVRRIIKPHLIGGSHWEPPETVFWYDPEDSIPIGQAAPHCPYGQPGDRLWVREKALYWTGGAGGTSDCIYQDDPEIRDYIRDQSLIDQAKEAKPQMKEHCGNWEWRSSIHMPRWASRITLEITGVRVERLQDISEEDAKAEGVRPNWMEGDSIAMWVPTVDGYLDYSRPEVDDSEDCIPLTARESYRTLWEKINGAGSWDLNPWIWAIGFKRVQP